MSPMPTFICISEEYVVAILLSLAMLVAHGLGVIPCFLVVLACIGECIIYGIFPQRGKVSVLALTLKVEYNV